MGKAVAVLLYIAMYASVFSEENKSNVNEVGLVFSNLNSFGMRYKFGNDNAMLRVTSLVLNGTATSNGYSNYSSNGIGDTDIPVSTTNSIGAGLNLGLEKRKWIGNSFCFCYGVDWINSYTQSRSNTITPNQTEMQLANGTFTVYTAVYNNTSNSVAWTASSGLGVFCGLSYKMNEVFSIATELEPSISYKYTKTTTSSTNKAIHWVDNAGVYTPNEYISSNVSQTTINKGFTGSLTNAAASIIITCSLERGSQKAK